MRERTIARLQSCTLRGHWLKEAKHRGQDYLASSLNQVCLAVVFGSGGSGGGVGWIGTSLVWNGLVF